MITMWAFLIIGVWFIAFSFLVTVNGKSQILGRLVFKILPFLAGLYCALYAATQMSWLGG
jgi:hypothetical protein